MEDEGKGERGSGGGGEQGKMSTSVELLPQALVTE